MKVQMKTRMSSEKYQAAPGEIIDVDNETAKALINGGFAVPVKDAPVIETATKQVPDNSMAARGKKK